MTGGLAASFASLCAIAMAVGSGARPETAVQRGLVVAVVAEVAVQLALFPWETIFHLESNGAEATEPAQDEAAANKPLAEATP